jgi:membrane peptidoglycan carboxypeptidase
VGQNSFVQPCSVAGSDSGNQAQTIADCNDLTGPVNGLIPNIGTSYTGKRPSSATPGSVTIALGENPLTPVEQATTFATLADDGLYHTPHVIDTLSQNGNVLPSHITATQVLSPAAAADVDYALSFDNNMSGATGEANVSFRRGGVIGKTGTLGTGSNSSEAWFIGAMPDQAAMSVALFTNNPGSQTLNNMGYVGGMPGTQGGGWPATIWNTFMKAVYGNTPPAPGGIFQADQTANGFAAWIQAQQQPPACNQQQWMQGLGIAPQGQTPQCTCPQNQAFCNTPPNPQQGNGNGNNNPFGNNNQNCHGPACPTQGASPTPSTTAAFVYGQFPPLTGPPVLLAEEAAVTRTTAVT